MEADYARGIVTNLLRPDSPLMIQVKGLPGNARHALVTLTSAKLAAFAQSGDN